MKKFILIFAIIFLFACKNEYKQKDVGAVHSLKYTETILVNERGDSCEYFVIGDGMNSPKLAHQGACKFCQARLEKTIQKYLQK